MPVLSKNLLLSTISSAMSMSTASSSSLTMLTLLLGSSSISKFDSANAAVAKDDDDDDDDDIADSDSKSDSSSVKKEPARPADWYNTPQTTELWKFVSKEDASRTEENFEIFMANFGPPGPTQSQSLSTKRSEDGRGGLWWAWEYKNAHALAVLKAFAGNEAGDGMSEVFDPLTVDEDMKDAGGKWPWEMCKGEDEELDTLDETASSTDSDSTVTASTTTTKVKDPKTDLHADCKALLEGIDEKVEVIQKAAVERAKAAKLKAEEEAAKKAKQEAEDLNSVDDDDDDDDDDEKVKTNSRDKKVDGSGEDEEL